MSYYLPKDAPAFFKGLGIKKVEDGLAGNEFKGTMKSMAEGWLSMEKERLTRRTTLIAISISMASASAAIAGVVIAVLK